MILLQASDNTGSIIIIVIFFKPSLKLYLINDIPLVSSILLETLHDSNSFSVHQLHLHYILSMVRHAFKAEDDNS